MKVKGRTLESIYEQSGFKQAQNMFVEPVAHPSSAERAPASWQIVRKGK